MPAATESVKLYKYVKSENLVTFIFHNRPLKAYCQDIHFFMLLLLVSRFHVTQRKNLK
jgi:hypothetical protein